MTGFGHHGGRMGVRLGMWVGLVAILAGGAGPAAAQQSSPPRVDFKKLGFMAGCWRGQLDRDSYVEEIWTEPSNNLLLSTTRYLTKDRATSYEFSRIEVTDSAVVFAASSEGRPFDVYTLKTLVDEYVVFENLSKTFPQRISYRRGSDGVLIPRNEGEGRTSIEVRLEKIKCPGT